MNKQFEYLEKWVHSKAKIFKCEKYKVTVSDIEDKPKKSKFITLDSNKLIGTVILWESGEVDLEAIDIQSENTVINKTTNITEICELDDELNWWLSEIAIYE